MHDMHQPGRRKGESGGEKVMAKKRYHSPARIDESGELEPAILRGDTHRILASRRARLRHRR